LNYSTVAETYRKLDEVSGRIEMTEILAELLKKTPRNELPMLAYLTQGKLRPDYEGVELGLAEKLALRVIGSACGLSQEAVYKTYVKLGDVGSAAEKLLSKKSQGTLLSERLTLERVYKTLLKVSQTSGEGSVEAKQRELASILNDASPLEAKYIMRTVTGELRLGVADYTVLDACAVAFLGSREGRPLLERAYNIHPDLGFVVETLAAKGLEGIRAIRVEVGVPIRPMLAERLDSAKAIIAKLGNKVVAAEYKLDGERLQIHKRNEDVTLFSRRLEVITHNYPDVLELVAKNVGSREAIMEAEVVAINEETGEYLPFQELMHRRRKYGVARAMKQYPVALNFFDLLSAEGRDYTNSPYTERRAKLESVVKETERTRLVPSLRTSDPEEIERFMEDAIASGCEGLVVKDLGGVYRAGAREFSWVKLKREYRSELTDTIDLVIVGAFHGRGRRAGTYGTYLLAAYDAKKDNFPTVSKIGTGFTDEDLEKFPRLLKSHESRVKPPNVVSNLVPDVWFRPHLVIETIASEITLSPIHPAGMGRIRRESGLALRFPKFTGKIRDDKKPEDATTVDEVVEMYNLQLKRVERVTQ